MATGALTSTTTYSVRAQYGQAFSPCATVTVTVLPAVQLTITKQPVSQTVVTAVGKEVEFTIAATGAGPLNYQWYYFDGTTGHPVGRDTRLGVSASPMPGLPQTFSYYCVVTDGFGGSHQSDTVTLTLLPPE